MFSDLDRADLLRKQEREDAHMDAMKDPTPRFTVERLREIQQNPSLDVRSLARALLAEMQRREDAERRTIAAEASLVAALGDTMDPGRIIRACNALVDNPDGRALIRYAIQQGKRGDHYKSEFLRLAAYAEDRDG